MRPRTPPSSLSPCAATRCAPLQAAAPGPAPAKKLFTLLDLCVSSLRRGHANLLCIVPILTDDPRRESRETRAGSHAALGTNSCRRALQAARPVTAARAKWLSVAQPMLRQRSLLPTQAHFPTTEDAVRFCLLCCQPEPLPASLSTRTSQLPSLRPCRAPTWSGQAIYAASRT